MDTNDVLSTLRREIEDGSLPPGAVLKQEALAERFKVSRQPVRQALDRLLESGLLDRRPDRSLAVAGLDADQARELVEVRSLLECAALRSAIASMTETDLRKARRLNEDLLEEEEPAVLEELDLAFHRTLYGRAGNARLLGMIDDLRRESRRAYSRQPKGSAERPTLYDDHNAIIEACARGDVAGASDALDRHLRLTTAPLVMKESQT